jgi:hypothetical protein
MRRLLFLSTGDFESAAARPKVVLSKVRDAVEGPRAARRARPSGGCELPQGLMVRRVSQTVAMGLDPPLTATLTVWVSNRRRRPDRSRQAASSAGLTSGGSVGVRMKSSISMSGPT